MKATTAGPTATALVPAAEPGPPAEEREMRAVAHELKTPLAIVFGYAQTLLQQDLPEESRRWFLKVIADQSRRLLRAIDRMEELTRLDGGVDVEIVDALDALREAWTNALESLPGARIEGPADVVGPLPARAARPWLDLALEEALVAAATAAGDGGRTVVEILPPAGREVRIRVDTTPAADAHGLGVFLARRILGALGGRLEEERGRLTLVLGAP